jgi:hypothetical protein
LTVAKAVLGVLLMLLTGGAVSSADAIPEDRVKAAYLYRFAGYVVWKGTAARDEPFLIDVIGAPGVARELRALLAGRRVNDRPAAVREVDGVRDAGTPQMIFLGPGQAGRLLAIAAALTTKSVLTVSDERGGLEHGAVINLVEIDRRVRFEVSLLAASRADLKISAELLGVAVRVEGEELARDS